MRVVVVLAAFAASCAPLDAEDTADGAALFRGTVVDARSGSPIKANVSYGVGWFQDGFQIVTADGSGRFTLVVPLGQRVRLGVFLEDYEELQSHIEAGVDNDVIFALKPIDDPCQVDGRQIAGVGIRLDYPSDGTVVVSKVDADGPAAGKLNPGFTIEAIDGIPVEGLEFGDVSLLSIGIVGSEVTFTGTRSRSTPKEDVAVTRAPVFMDYEHPRWWVCDHVTGRGGSGKWPRTSPRP